MALCGLGWILPQKRALRNVEEGQGDRSNGELAVDSDGESRREQMTPYDARWPTIVAQLYSIR
jgi:hypothetical protein